MEGSSKFINMPVVCRLCEDAPCVRACPRDALRQSEETSVVQVDEEKCNSCGWCIEACPYGAITVHPEKKTVMICDLCDGQPQCVEWCPEDALNLITQKTFNENIRKATVTVLIPESWR